MITEEQRLVFVNSLSGYCSSGYVDFNGVSYTGHIFRENDQFSTEEPSVMITWIPMNKKEKTISIVRGKRDNPLYNNYGYMEYDACILTAFAEDTDGMRGRRIADGWLIKLETYIKNNWNRLINKIGVKLDSFTTHREMPEFFSERLYGLETRFEMISPNEWTDEPSGSARSDYLISGISFTKGPVSGETGMIEMWVTN